MPQLPLSEIHSISRDCLRANGADDANAAAVADTITQAELHGSHSHGIFRLPGYAIGLRSGQVDGTATPLVEAIAPGVLDVDGRGGFAPLPLLDMTAPLVALAEQQGVAVAAVRNVFHFAALWPEVTRLAEHGLVAIACTAALPYVAPTGGSTALFGTNPIAFAWPRPDRGVYCSDLSTAAMARGDIKLAARDGRHVALGVGLDGRGQPTTDPNAILDGGVQLPVGAHKGSALALMVELLAGALIGDRFSFEAEAVYPHDGGPPLGGEFVLAINPNATTSSNWSTHAEGLFAQIEAMPQARLSGDRRRQLAARTNPTTDIPQTLLDTIADLTPPR